MVLGVGIFFRLYKIETIPFGMNHDGAWSGLWAIELSQKPWPIQVYSDQGWLGEAMPRYVMAIFIKLLGPTNLALRLGMMVFSIAALPLFFLFVRYAFGNYWVAIWSTLLLSTSGWDILYGKTGWRTSAVPVFVIVTCYFLMKSMREGKIRWYILTGIFMGLTIHTYNAGHFIPVTVMGALLSLLVRRRTQWKKLTVRYGWLLIAFAVTIAPLASYALNNWETYTGRARYLFVLNKVNRAGSWYPAWENIKYAMLMYTARGHFGADFYLTEPLLDFPANWLFLIGFGVTFWKLREHPYGFTLWLLLTSLIPSLAGNPDGGHAIGTIPAVYMMAGIGFYALTIRLGKMKLHAPSLAGAAWYPPSSTELKSAEACIHPRASESRGLLRRRMKFVSGKLIQTGFGAAVAMSAMTTTYRMYFGPGRNERWGFYPETTVVANFIKPKFTHYDVYITDNYPRDTLTYLTYRGGDPWEKQYTWFDDKNKFFSVSPSGNKGVMFVMFPTPENRSIAESLGRKFPGSETIELRYLDDTINRGAASIVAVQARDR